MSLEPVVALSGHTDRVWHICWDPKGDYLASCGGDKSIRIWSTPKGESQEWNLMATLEDGQTRTIRCCEFSPCGKFLAAVSFDATCVIWELHRSEETNEMEWELAASVEGHEHEAKSVAWNRSGTLLATCSRDKSVWIWECLKDNDFECLSVLHGHEQDVKFVKFHPTEDVLFSASYDDTIKVWREEEEDWACIATLKGHSSTVWGLSVGNRDDGLVSCSDDKTLLIWKATDKGQWRSVCRLSGYHTSTIYSVDWSRNTGAIASGGADDSIRIFVEDPDQPQGWSADLPSFVCDVHRAHAHASDVNCVRWNPVRSDLLASAGDDHMVRLWRYGSEK